MRLIFVLLFSIHTLAIAQQSKNDEYSHLSDSQKDEILNDLKTAKNLVTSGLVLHASGLSLCFFSFPIGFAWQNDYTVFSALSITGLLCASFSPGLSVIGSVKANRVYKRNDLSVIRKPHGWIYYSAALTMNLIACIGSSRFKESNYLWALAGGEVFNIISMINSYRFVEYNGYKHANLSKVSVQVSPNITANKAVGLKMSAIF